MILLLIIAAYCIASYYWSSEILYLALDPKCPKELKMPMMIIYITSPINAPFFLAFGLVSRIWF
jgi:hypothetical protein